MARIAEDEADIRNELVGRRWPNPGRSLAECEAKRRIVERCAPLEHWGIQSENAHVWLAINTLKDLALPHADHPDYRDEWRALS